MTPGRRHRTLQRAARIICIAVLPAWLGAGGGAMAARQDSRLADAQTTARAASARGAFEEAAEAWKRAAALARRARNDAELIDALIGLAAAYHSAGEHRLAVEALVEARELAKSASDYPRLAAALNGLGAVRTFSRDAEMAKGHLREALALARKAEDRKLVAAVLNNLGILLSAQGKFAQAADAYNECASSAAGAGDALLAAKARVNFAEAAARSGDFQQAVALNRSAVAAVLRTPDSHDRSYALSRCGKTWEFIFEQAPEHDQHLRLKALEAYQAAARTGEAVGDARGLSYALGYIGHLYEQEKKYGEALQLTRRAAFQAQKAQCPDALYLWDWQTGRINKAEGRREEAIEDYRRAVHNLGLIRNDLSSRLGNANARSSFRQAAGDAYFELADLLLQRTDGLKDEAAVMLALKEARDTCEELKSVELEDYFQDDCVNLLKAKSRAVENLSGDSAVVYLIPLKDRTEIIVSAGGKLSRIKTTATADQITATARAFREHLETRTSFEYLDEAQRLYDWLIRPLEPLVRERRIDTLVFVPDGALRSVPMAALHDGGKFLIEKYAVAVTPGLTLMESKPIKRVNVSLMAGGLTEEVQRDGQTFAALPFVREEISRLEGIYGGRVLMDDQFRSAVVQQEFSKHPYSIVHIASHGEFNGDVRKTFVVTYDDRMNLDGLERLIRPSRLREQPVELLTLSACQTAAGDDRAALGLAGVAVKAGARSAFATLWYVNDEASTTLITTFYETLRGEPEISKAKALQRAQIKLLSDARTSHPCLWAPYLLIGNWL